MNAMTKWIGLALLLSMSTTAPAVDRVNTLEKGFFGYKASGVAIGGYDTVAYFTFGQAVEGVDEFQGEWQGVTWKFATREHLQRFEADPHRYAPQFGGYCAYGVATGELWRGDAEHWAIVDGRLYLNYDAEWMGKWEADRSKMIAEAEIRFDTLISD